MQQGHKKSSHMKFVERGVFEMFMSKWKTKLSFSSLKLCSTAKEKYKPIIHKPIMCEWILNYLSWLTNLKWKSSSPVQKLRIASKVSQEKKFYFQKLANSLWYFWLFLSPHDKQILLIFNKPTCIFHSLHNRQFFKKKSTSNTPSSK